MTNADPAGMASLIICEALLLALREGKVLNDYETNGLLEDARNAHLVEAASSDDPESHRRAAEMIEAIRTGSNSLRTMRKMG